MILIWYCFYNLNETAVCALDIFLVVGELWTKREYTAYTKPGVIFIKYDTVCHTNLDWCRQEQWRQGKATERGVLSVILEGISACDSETVGNWFKNSATERCWKKKGEETGICTGWKLEPSGLTFYTHKTNLFYSHTSQIVQVWEFNLHPFLCFFELPTDVTFLPTLFVSHFLFWRLVISYEQSWLLDNMKQVSILYRPAVDLFGLELNWWPGLFTSTVYA